MKSNLKKRMKAIKKLIKAGRVFYHVSNDSNTINQVKLALERCGVKYDGDFKGTVAKDTKFFSPKHREDLIKGLAIYPNLPIYDEDYNDTGKVFTEFNVINFNVFTDTMGNKTHANIQELK